jgi:hypothetical protein
VNYSRDTLPESLIAVRPAVSVMIVALKISIARFICSLRKNQAKWAHLALRCDQLRCGSPPANQRSLGIFWRFGPCTLRREGLF